jgi:hypothetical protein
MMHPRTPWGDGATYLPLFPESCACEENMFDDGAADLPILSVVCLLPVLALVMHLPVFLRPRRTAVSPLRRHPAHVVRVHDSTSPARRILSTCPTPWRLPGLDNSNVPYYFSRTVSLHSLRDACVEFQVQERVQTTKPTPQNRIQPVEPSI